MHERALGRAVALGAAALLLVSTTALADSVKPSGDGVVLESNGNVDLGTVAPGQTVAVDLVFKVVCGGSTHVAAGTNVGLAVLSADGPLGGSISISDAAVGPAPSDWPPTTCDATRSFAGGSPSHVVVTAPAAEGLATYVLVYSTTASPSGGVGRYVGVTLDLTVVADQPPVLQLPASMTVEGNTTGGANVSYAATATDAEDVPPPTPTCSPASGVFFPLGMTTVACSATDSVGHTVRGSFDVTVVDTTAPALSNVPTALSVNAYDVAGATATWLTPHATDIVDDSPIVTCEPPPGSLFQVGETTVTCRGTDASGNGASVTFPVAVTLVRLGAMFDPPIGPSNIVTINPGRTVPVKATVAREGEAVTGGGVALSLASCTGGALREPEPLVLQGGRWFLGLDTAGLSGCVNATLLLDGHPAGAFRMLASGSSTLAPRRPR